VDSAPPEYVAQVKRLVSSSVADLHARLLHDLGTRTRQLGECVDRQLVELYSQALHDQCSDNEDAQLNGIQGHHAGESSKTLTIGSGIATLRRPHMPALTEDSQDRDAALCAVPSFTSPFESLQEVSAASKRGEEALVPEAGAVGSSPANSHSQQEACACAPKPVPSSDRLTARLFGSLPQMISEKDSGMIWRDYDANRLQRLVNTSTFEMVFSSIILLNCGTMGLEAHDDISEEMSGRERKLFDIAEHVFTILFSLEIFLRAKANGWSSFLPNDRRNWWNFVDAMFVVFTGILFTWLIPLFALLLGVSGDHGIIRVLTVLRVVRLIRLVRVFQRVPAFREAWQLIRGLTDSVRTLFWTCVVIFFVTYVFSIFGLVLMVSNVKDQYNLAEDGSEQQNELGNLMHTLGGMDRLMFMLIQVLTMDSFHATIRVLIKYVSWSWAFFYSYIAVAVFVLMNLVTAVIVDNALSSSRRDIDHELKRREKAKDSDLKELRTLFLMMDSDGSGTLSWSEFKDAFNDPEMAKKWMLLDFQPEECRELFSLLDDGDGEIETTEFFDGLGRMKGPAASKDIFRLQKALDKLRYDLEENGALMAAKQKLSRMPSMGSAA